jgi:hypothetical protein
LASVNIVENIAKIKDIIGKYGINREQMERKPIDNSGG